MPLITDGITKTRILDMANSFEATGATVNRGIPYIYDINLETVVYVSAKNSDDELYDYRILRALDSVTTTAKTKFRTKINDTKRRKSLDVDLADSGKYVVGLVNHYSGSGDIYVTNLDSYLGNGNVIFRRIFKPDGSIKTIPIDINFPKTEKLIGLVPYLDSRLSHYISLMIAITVPTSGSITGGADYTNCKWYLFSLSSKKGFVGSGQYAGNVVGSVNVETFGFGRSAIHANTCAVAKWRTYHDLSDDAFIWTACGKTPFKIQLWKWDASNDLTLVDTAQSTEGLSDGSYAPSKPGLWLEKGALIVIAADILYSYRSSALSGTQYDTTLIPLTEIIKNETETTGFFDGVAFIEDDSSFSENIFYDPALQQKLIHGMILGEGVLRDSFEKVNNLFSLEIIPKGYGIKFQERNETSVATIPWDHLGAGADSDSEDAKLTHSRVMDAELPKTVTLNFKDPYRLYSESVVQSKYQTTLACTEEQIDSPVFITESEADVLVKNILNMRWAERDTFEIKIPFIYAYLEPGDIITLEIPFDDGVINTDCRIVKINHGSDWVITLKLTATQNLVYTRFITEDETPPTDIDDPVVEELQTAELVFLDIPCVDAISESEFGAPSVVATLNENAVWGGAKTKFFNDTISSSQNYEYVIDFSNTDPFVVGNVTNVASASTGVLVDRGTVLTVDLVDLTTELSSVDDMFLSDDTLFAYGSVENGWEICKFETATLVDVATNTYEVSNLLRGLYGTEHLTGTHVENDFFVLLNQMEYVQFNNSYVLGTTLFTKTVCPGQTEDELEFGEAVYNAINLKPYSGVRAAATRDIADDITLTWVRRGRYDNDWADDADIPIAETSENYEVDVMDGATIVRTLHSTSESVVYTEAQQVADFGVAQPSVTFRIYQISAEAGRGTAYEVTL